MLVLSRKRGESIQIGDGIVITILDVRPSRTRLGIDAPLSVRVQREEVSPRAVIEDLAEMIDLDSSTVDLREDSVKSPGSSGALGAFQNRKVTGTRI